MLARRFKPYGLTATWFRTEAEAGRLPCLRAGPRLLFDADAVERALIARAGGALVHRPGNDDGLDDPAAENRRKGEVR